MEVEYVYPQYIASLGIQGGILPEDVEKALEQDPDIQAVLVVSPTYDGIVSDVRGIADAAHRHGIPLIVDEAHGAHFPFGRKAGFPVTALECGADIVIQSLHKTLPSFTQTAVLHLREGKADRERIERYLQMFQRQQPFLCPDGGGGILHRQDGGVGAVLVGGICAEDPAGAGQSFILRTYEACGAGTVWKLWRAGCG